VKHSKLAIFLLGLAGTFGLAGSSLACTDFRVLTKDGATIIGRSLEFGLDLKSHVVSTPRNTAFSSQAPDGSPALSWKSKYGYLYMDALNTPIVLDGMNEEGLSFEYLYLPGYTQYQTVPANGASHALPYYLFGNWILGNFKTVDEVRAALKNIVVFQQAIPGLPANQTFEVHAIIHDATGKELVVEFVKGQMMLHEGVGVVTNGPTYEWQVNNLKNYLQLSPYTPQPITANGFTYSSNGQGSGMLGVPGDQSPPSRLVKTAAYLKFALPSNNAAEGVTLAEHVLNSVDIPLGVSRAKEANGQDSYDYTQWIVIKDLTNKVFYYRTYNDQTFHSVSLKQLDFSPNADALKMPIDNKPNYIDMTEQLKKSKS
jgi:choloylglycine hydrolase